MNMVAALVDIHELSNLLILELSPSKSVTYFGVIQDRKLNCSEQIDRIYSKVKIVI